jgi:hypothetical protein
MPAKIFLALRVLAIPLLVAAIAFFELDRPVGPFRLFTLISLFLLLADATSLCLGRLRDFLLVASSLAFGLSVLEAAASYSVPEAEIVATPNLTVRQPVIGWGPRRPGRFHVRKFDPENGTVIYDVHYTIDKNLLRETNSCEACATVAFFGDSMTFGEGINDSDTLPQTLANDFDGKLRVLNLGYSGYGPQQFLRELQTGRFDSVLGKNPKLFVFLTGNWMVERSACKSPWILYAPRYELENKQVVYKGACDTGPMLWLRQWLVHSALYREFIEPSERQVTKRDVDLNIGILKAAAALAKSKYGAEMVFPYIGADPMTIQIVRELQAAGADVVDVSLSELAPAGDRLNIPGDGHPTPLANRLRAAILKTYIERKFAGDGRIVSGKE